MNRCTRAHPLTSLDLTSIVKPSPEGAKRTHKRPHRIRFRVTLALDSEQTLDKGWTQQQCASRSKAAASLNLLQNGTALWIGAHNSSVLLDLKDPEFSRQTTLFLCKGMVRHFTIQKEKSSFP